MHKDHGGWRHLNASLEDKVGLSEDYRFTHLPQRLDVSGEARIKLLEDCLKGSWSSLSASSFAANP